MIGKIVFNINSSEICSLKDMKTMERIFLKVLHSAEINLGFKAGLFTSLNLCSYKTGVPYAHDCVFCICTYNRLRFAFFLDMYLSSVTLCL